MSLSGEPDTAELSSATTQRENDSGTTEVNIMASVDLKDAYYSVPIASEDRKFLKFEWKGDYYQYTCLPNGLACAPRWQIIYQTSSWLR